MSEVEGDPVLVSLPRLPRTIMEKFWGPKDGGGDIPEHRMTFVEKPRETLSRGH